MLPLSELACIAQQIKTAQDQQLHLGLLTAQHPGFDVSDAYAAGRMVHAARLAEGARPVGRKIGFTNPAMWARYGVGAPVWAYMYDSTVRHVAPASARCSLVRFVEPRIEPEIVFHFHSAPPPGGDLAALLACIDWVAHGFEIVQSHFAGWKFQAPDAIADGGLHGELLVGPPQPVESLGGGLQKNLEAFTLELLCDGEIRDVGTGANVLGSPLAALAHLVAVLAEQSPLQPIQAHEIVTTGTLTGAYVLRPGQTWQTRLGGIGLPGLSVSFTE